MSLPGGDAGLARNGEDPGDSNEDLGDVPVGYTSFYQPGGSPMVEPDEEDPIDRTIGIFERRAG